MTSLDCSPQELLHIADMWEDFVGVKDRRNDREVSRPKYYPFEICEQEAKKNEAKKEIVRRKTRAKGVEILTILAESSFSKKAESFLENMKIKEAIQILLAK